MEERDKMEWERGEREEESEGSRATERGGESERSE